MKNIINISFFRFCHLMLLILHFKYLPFSKVYFFFLTVETVKMHYLIAMKVGQFKIGSLCMNCIVLLHFETIFDFVYCFPQFHKAIKVFSPVLMFNQGYESLLPPPPPCYCYDRYIYSYNICKFNKGFLPTIRNSVCKMPGPGIHSFAHCSFTHSLISLKSNERL